MSRHNKTCRVCKKRISGSNKPGEDPSTCSMVKKKEVKRSHQMCSYFEERNPNVRTT